VLGLGAAMIMPLSLAILPRVFIKQELSRAIAVWTAATALGMPIGPIVGGWLLDHFDWTAVFLFNVPIVALALTAAVVLLPADRPQAQSSTTRRFDLIGALQSALGISAVVYATIRVSDHGWTDPVVLVSIGVGVGLMAQFVCRQKRVADPLVDLTLFRIPAFGWGATLAVFVNFAVMGILFVVPQYLAGALHWDALRTGLGLLPMIGGLLAAATAAEKLVTKFGARLVIPAGLTLLSLGAFVGARTGVGDGYGYAAVWLSIVGVGFGLAVVPATELALGVLPEDGAGRGTSLLESVQQLGAVLGVAALGSVFGAGYTDRLPDLTSAFTHGMSRVLDVVALVAIVGALVAVFWLPSFGRGRDAAVSQLEQGEWTA
jgi:MFS family permease